MGENFNVNANGCNITGELVIAKDEFNVYSTSVSKSGVIVKSRRKSNTMLANGKMKPDEIRREVWIVSNGELEKMEELTVYGVMENSYVVPEQEAWTQKVNKE